MVTSGSSVGSTRSLTFLGAQHDTTTPAGIDHVGMIVGNPGSQGGYNVQIAQHSANKIENLSDWKKKNPNLHYWIYSIYYH